MQPAPPCSAPASSWQMLALGVAIRHIICGFYLFIFPPAYVALRDSKTPHRPTGESVSWCLETSLLRLSSWDGSPSLPLLSLFLSFIFCPTSFRRQRAARCLMSSASIQKLFCGICSAFKCTFIEFVGEKLVSPSYPSAILGTPPSSGFLFKKVLDFFNF